MNDTTEHEQNLQAELAYLTKGDLAGLSDEQLVHIYKIMCARLGWDWEMRPFGLIPKKEKNEDGATVETLRLYPNRVAAALLARQHGIKVEDRGERWDWDAGLYYASARAIALDGRYWDDDGVVSIVWEKDGEYRRLWPNALANAVKTAKTQARRRAILGLTGLGRPDSDEMQTSTRAEVRPVPLPEPAPRPQVTTAAPAVRALPLPADFPTWGQKQLAAFIGTQQARLRGLHVKYPAIPREASGSNGVEILRDYAASLVALAEAATQREEWQTDLPDQDF